MSVLTRLKVYGKVLENEPMKKHTTYHIGGNTTQRNGFDVYPGYTTR